MSTDLALIQPASGEILDLAAPLDQLARWIDELREHERQSKEIRGHIDVEILRRLDLQAKWTAHVDGFKVTAPSPAPKVEWDTDLLRMTLAGLRRDELVSDEAADAALEIVVSYKSRAAGLNALMKLGGVVAERLAECRSEVEPVRRVSVRQER